MKPDNFQCDKLKEYSSLNCAQKQYNIYFIYMGYHISIVHTKLEMKI
jgi:hypothetical protein